MIFKAISYFSFLQFAKSKSPFGGGVHRTGEELFIWVTFFFLFLAISSNAQNKDCYIDTKPSEFQVCIDSCTNEILIDVRPNEVFKNRKLPNAVLVPTKGELHKIADTVDTDTPILVYCAIGVRSETVCKILCEKEFTTVINLKGGIDKWKKEGFETIHLKEE